MKEAPIFFTQDDKHFMDFVTPTGETKIVEVPMPKNQMLHNDNLSHHTGFYKGVYRREGVPTNTVPKGGDIYVKRNGQV
jgi:hypothetical protein